MNYENGPKIPEDGVITGYLRWYYEFEEWYHMLEEIRKEQKRELWNGRSDDDNCYLQNPYDGKE